MYKVYETTKDSLKTDIPDFKSGDSVKVGVKVISLTISTHYIFIYNHPIFPLDSFVKCTCVC